MKIDFTQLELFTDVAHTRCVRTDVRQALADGIYMNVPGMDAHALCHKLYDTHGPADYTAAELRIIEQVSRGGIPALRDTILDLLRQAEEAENNGNTDK